MPAKRKYYTLVIRENGCPWGVEFGDYDLETVEDELECFKSSYNYRNFKFKIFVTDGTQKAIDNRVVTLNRKVLDTPTKYHR